MNIDLFADVTKIYLSYTSEGERSLLHNNVTVLLQRGNKW